MTVAAVPFDTGFGLRSERRMAIDHLALPSGARILLVTGPRALGRPWQRVADMLPTIDERFDLVLDVAPARVPFQFPSGHFDAVVLHGVLDSVVNPCEVTREAARVLAPEGRISIYGAFVPRGFSPPLWRKGADGLPVTWNAPRDLEEILEVSGAGLCVAWQTGCLPGSALRMVELRKA